MHQVHSTKENIKKAMTRVIFEPTGPYLMVNVTGVDGKGNELLSPHYVEFPIKPGLHLQKKKLNTMSMGIRCDSI